MNTIITIGREFGSGGHEIGMKLAEELGIPFYDKLLVSMVSEEGEFAQKYLEEMDEKVNIHIAPFLATRSNYSVYNQPVSDKIFFRQAEIIRKLADEGACVIVGRCADYILYREPRSFRVFLHARPQWRAQELAERKQITPEQAADELERTDAARARYYQNFTGRKWGDTRWFHLTVDTEVFDREQCVALILEGLKLRGEI